MLILNISAKNKFAAQTSNLRIDYLTSNHGNFNKTYLRVLWLQE